ncbi:hypothetical protein PJ267_19250 [Arthrobacter sp. OVS8]|nr:hypothetical protein PJ267_19250 [Arthrobacter sp. OVS8]
MSEMWPLLRPLSRSLALLGWASSATGMTAGLAIAIASGTRLSPMMSTLQLVAMASTAVAVASFVTAASVQPRPGALDDVEPEDPDSGGLPDTVQSLLLGSVALLAGAVVFAVAGLLLRSGPSTQSVAFCQVFFLGAAASGFTFLLFSKVAPRRSRN